MTRLTLQTKLFAVVAGLAISIVIYLSATLPAQHVESLRRGISERSLSYARLAARELEPAVAFDDQQTARETFDAIALDPDVRALTLFAEDGRVLASRGEGSEGAPQDVREAMLLPERDDVVRAAAPVVSREGPRGLIVVELHASSLGAMKRSVRLSTLAVGLPALFLSLLVAFGIGRSVSKRIHRLGEAAASVAEGDLGQPVVASGSDEIADLARSFDRMRLELVKVIRERERAAATVVLAHVRTGFLALARSGAIGEERSKIVEQWLGRPSPDMCFADYVARVDPETGAELASAWEQLVDGSLPLDLCIDQLPKTMRTPTGTFALGYAIDRERILVVIEDVTASLLQRSLEQERIDVASALPAVVANARATEEFLTEADRLVAIIDSPDTASTDRRRALHTLKGNSALFGLAGVSSACHDLESQLAEGMSSERRMRSALATRWARTTSLLRSISAVGAHSITMSRREQSDLVAAILGGESRTDLARRVRAFELESAATRLGRLAEQTQVVARRIDRTVDVTTEDNGLRLDPALAPFFSGFVHLIRNALDHGIEPANEREKAGKRPVGRIAISTRIEAGELVIAMADDGRGIDWERIRNRATAAGLAATTVADLQSALFADGITSKDQVTQTSGRGIGLSAVAASTELLGRTRVRSESGAGTTFEFFFPGRLAHAPRPTSLETPRELS